LIEEGLSTIVMNAEIKIAVDHPYHWV